MCNILFLSKLYIHINKLITIFCNINIITVFKKKSIMFDAHKLIQ